MGFNSIDKQGYSEKKEFIFPKQLYLRNKSERIKERTLFLSEYRTVIQHNLQILQAI